MKRKTTNTSLRNFVWIIAGIIFMAVMVVATTTISDTAITTTGNLNIDGNISFDNSPLHFQSNGNSLLFINHSDGNVGIGTATPTERLQVSGGNFSVNNSDLFVDIFTSRVGIRTNTPQYMLDMGMNTYVGFDGLFGHIIQHNSASSQFWSSATRNNGNYDIATSTTDPRPGGLVISSSNAKLTITPNGDLDVVGTFHANSSDYSLSEIDTGAKWIDGKTIFRRVYVVADIGGAGLSVEITLGSTVDTAIEIGGYVIEITSNDKIFIGAGVGDSGGAASVAAEITNSGTKLLLDANNNLDWQSGHVWIEYTK